MPLTFEFISVKSYHGTQSTGTVKISGADTTALHGKHCLLCEDIIDSGTVTLAWRYMQITAACTKSSYSHWIPKRTLKPSLFDLPTFVLMC